MTEVSDNNDEYGFWSNEPTRPLERLNIRRKLAGPAPIAPTRPRSRPYVAPVVGRRQHGHTAQVPVTPPPFDHSIDFDDVTFDDLDEFGGYDEPLDQDVPATQATVTATVVQAARNLREATGHVDPLLRRIGALVLIVALAIPVALSLRDDKDARASLSPQDSVAQQASTAPAVTELGQAAPAGEQGAQDAAQATIDIDALPEAIPVNTTTAGESPVVTQTATPPATEAETAVTQPVTHVNQPAQVSKSACKSYTVVTGDYWILIAKKVSVSVGDLLAANNATTSTALYPGQSICLPANASAPTTAPPATTAPPTTAPPTTVKVTTTTAAPPKTYTRAEVEAIIRAVWPDDLENEAVRIATRESNLNPAVRNYCCYGLFQIYWNVHKSWLIPMGVTSPEQLYDPMVNAYAAYLLYQRAGGWGPWAL